MEEEPPSPSVADDPSYPCISSLPRRSTPPRRVVTFIIFCLAFFAFSTPAVPADTLAKVQASGRLIFGSDEEGGAPFIYLDRDPPHQRKGFEIDLMAAVGRELDVRAEFHQGMWDNLLQILGRGEVDVVVNGYELTERRARESLATRPYYVYQLQLMALPSGPVHSMADLNLPRPGGGRWKLGVLGNSVADFYAQKLDPHIVSVIRYDGSTNAMTSVRNGQIDATLQDLPAATFYGKQPEFADLRLVGPPEGCGYYVMYVRRGDRDLRDALDAALTRLIDSGELKRICDKYDLWNRAQTVLTDWRRNPSSETARPRLFFDLGLLRSFASSLLLAAATTFGLAVASMPLAMLIGLFTALGRMYGPVALRRILDVYVEIVRGTPLMLQLYVIFYVLPELGITLHPWTSGILGLAINYSAYEAEIYRAGLQAIPKGQMEAALALGMSRGLALRRVIVPQAARIVIPPVTSDFIALFKDTSVCSVVTLVELTKQYSILSNSIGGVVEFGLATAALYLAMSLPLSWFSRWIERRLDPEGSEATGVSA